MNNKKMDLLQYTQDKKNSTSKRTLIFENEHIKVEDTGYEYEIECFDEIGVKALHDTFLISTAKSKICSSIDEVEEFYNLSVEDKQEGIMIKVLGKEYRAGKKIGYMYKMKPTSEDIDCVIVGAERGKGKRGGFFSSFYVAVLVNGEFKTIGKVGSGLKEDENEELSMQHFTKILSEQIISEDTKTGITYFNPHLIIQVAYQDLQESQTTGSKYALRFPKIVAIRNSDKTLDDVTTLEEVLAQKGL